MSKHLWCDECSAIYGEMFNDRIGSECQALGCRGKITDRKNPVVTSNPFKSTTKFNKIVDNRIEITRELLISKGEEYARGDRLSNFKTIASLLDQTPEEAWRGMWIKHIESILSMVKDIADGKPVDLPKWKEKIGDNIVYSILLEAIVEERYQQENMNNNSGGNIEQPKEDINK